MYLVTFNHWEDDVLSSLLHLVSLPLHYTFTVKLKALYNAGSLHKHTAWFIHAAAILESSDDVDDDTACRWFAFLYVIWSTLLCDGTEPPCKIMWSLKSGDKHDFAPRRELRYYGLHITFNPIYLAPQLWTLAQTGEDAAKLRSLPLSAVSICPARLWLRRRRRNRAALSLSVVK